MSVEEITLILVGVVQTGALAIFAFLLKNAMNVHGKLSAMDVRMVAIERIEKQVEMILGVKVQHGDEIQQVREGVIEIQQDVAKRCEACQSDLRREMMHSLSDLQDRVRALEHRSLGHHEEGS